MISAHRAARKLSYDREPQRRMTDWEKIRSRPEPRIALTFPSTCASSGVSSCEGDAEAESEEDRNMSPRQVVNSLVVLIKSLLIA
jgi:hypothetical protein